MPVENARGYGSVSGGSDRDHHAPTLQALLFESRVSPLIESRHRRAARAEPLERLVDVVHGEHDA